MQILLFFFLLILMSVLIGLYLIGKVIRGVAGLFKSSKKQSFHADDNRENSSDYAHRGGKIFSDEEGEYVDFEDTE